MGNKRFQPILTAAENRKGVLDVDTVKGCEYGMKAHPDGGCYGLCYAKITMTRYGFDFARSVSRRIPWNRQGRREIEVAVARHPASWFRIGTMGDPSSDWPLTIRVCEWLSQLKIPVIITKHWIPFSDSDLESLRTTGAIVNTSISPLDTEEERIYRLNQFRRLSEAGVHSLLRIVSCKFGDTEEGRARAAIQDELFRNNAPIIDNPLRIPRTDPRVVRGDILVDPVWDIESESSISRFNDETFVGVCSECLDQCGVAFFENQGEGTK